MGELFEEPEEKPVEVVVEKPQKEKKKENHYLMKEKHN